jgi:hypothetical protein
MTGPFLDALLQHAMDKHTDFIQRVFSPSTALLTLTEERFSKFFRHSAMLEQLNEKSMLCLLSFVSDEVLQEAAAKEQLRFKMLHEGLLSGQLQVDHLVEMDHSQSMTMTMPSHLAFHIFDRPEIARELIRRKFPVNSMLAGVDLNDGTYFRTVLSEAAYQGDVEAVEMLLDAGADIEQSVGNDPWNAIVYAVASGDEEMTDIFRERFSKHPIWRSNSIPLRMKTLPRKDPWFNNNNSSMKTTSSTNVEDDGPLGSVDDLVASFASEEHRLQMEEMTGAMKGFSGFGGGFSFSSNF